MKNQQMSNKDRFKMLRRLLKTSSIPLNLEKVVLKLSFGNSDELDQWLRPSRWLHKQFAISETSNELQISDKTESQLDNILAFLASRIKITIKEDFLNIINGTKPAFILFWSEYDIHGLLMCDLFEEFTVNYEGKMDCHKFEVNKDCILMEGGKELHLLDVLADLLKITYSPTFIICYKGKVIGRCDGVTTREKLLDMTQTTLKICSESSRAFL